MPEGAYIAMFWFVILGFSFLGARAYGEAEFWVRPFSSHSHAG